MSEQETGLSIKLGDKVYNFTVDEARKLQKKLNQILGGVVDLSSWEPAQVKSYRLPEGWEDAAKGIKPPVVQVEYHGLWEDPVWLDELRERIDQEHSNMLRERLITSLPVEEPDEDN